MNYLFKKICIASDHCCYNLKEFIKNLLVNKNVSIIDLGPFENKKEDIRKKLPRVIVHELTHVWHDHTSKVMQKYLKTSRKTNNRHLKRIQIQ